MGDDRVRSGLHLISSVVRAFAEATTDYHLLLETIARMVARTIPDSCVLLLRGPDGRLTPAAIHDPDPRVIAAVHSVLGQPHTAYDAPLAAEAMERGPLLLPQVDLTEMESTRPGAPIAMLREVGVRGMLVVPLRSHGEALGALSIMRHDPRHPPLDELDLEIVEDLAGHAALALRTARLVNELQVELERRTAAELASTFLDAIIENIPDMVFVKEAERLAFVRFNRAGEDLLGVGRDQLMGKNDFDFFPASEAEFFVAKDRETLANKTMVDIPEEPIHTASGQRWLHTKKVPIVDASGTARYLLGISRDITADRIAAARLLAAQRAHDQTNREIESFTYSVVHDLRAPLRAILGYARAVLEDHQAALPGDAAHQLGRIRESAERMTVLIDDLVGLSRVTRAELVIDRVDLTAIAHSVVAGLRAHVPERSVEVAIAPELVAEGDVRMLAVVLENLLENAWKFTSKRTDARIELGARDGAFFVRDNGAGFDPAHTDQLFGVFHRLHREVDYPGTGIGLATVARIVHRHRGRVWAEGAIGQGATFYFALGEP